MKIVNKKIQDIIKNEKLNSKFSFIKHNSLEIECNIFTENFFLDSYNFFPITEEHTTFLDVFTWGEPYEYEHFYSKFFLDNFIKNKDSFKSFSNVFVLGSSLSDNYYRNMITFLPRIFFINKKNIKLAIHRNSSNKFRNFLEILFKQMQIKVQFIYLDNGFYKFINSHIPEFLDHSKSIKILNSLRIIQNKKKEKIYLTRQNSAFRNLVNEEDVVDILKKKNFRIIDLNNLSIVEQIELFSNSEIIVSVSGSSLTNIAFCSPGTKVIEIIPKYNFDYEKNLKTRFSNICKLLNLNYSSIEADPINLESSNSKSQIFINKKTLKESNYYKNLLLKLDKINNLF